MPETLYSLGKAASLNGDSALAEKAWTKLIAIEKQSPLAAQAHFGLAGLYRKQDKNEQAEPLYQRALAIQEKMLGPEHPELATYLNNLALFYEAQGDYEQAESLFQRALTIRELVFGPTHPYTMQARTNYNSLLEQMKQKGNGR